MHSIRTHIKTYYFQIFIQNTKEDLTSKISIETFQLIFLISALYHIQETLLLSKSRATFSQ